MLISFPFSFGGFYMRPIWDPSGQPAYQTPVKPGCTPHWIHGTHIGMFAGMYLHVYEPVRRDLSQRNWQQKRSLFKAISYFYNL